MTIATKVIEQAEKELEEELFREAVEKHKEKLKTKKWYNKLFPYKIIIKRID
jgi:hypothetical protein